MKLIPFSSPTDRAKETGDEVLSAMESEVQNTLKESLTPELFRNSSMIFTPLGGRPDFTGFEKLFYELVKEKGRSVQDVCNKFWNNELEIKPEMVIGKFMNTLGMIFKNSIRRNRKNSIISYRHGDKDKDGNLTKEGKEQAKNLGKDLVNEVDKEGVTILAATHNVFNETVIHYIFSDEELPKEWDNLLDFTESVKYTFYPQEGENKPYLEVDWRGFKKQISYEKFQKLMEKVNNSSTKDL